MPSAIMFDFYIFLLHDWWFFQKIEATYWQCLKHNNNRLRKLFSQLKISEIVFITIWYKCSYFNNVKAFFFSLKKNHSQLFRCLPCYQWIIYLIRTHQLALHAFLTLCFDKRLSKQSCTDGCYDHYRGVLQWSYIKIPWQYVWPVIESIIDSSSK